MHRVEHVMGFPVSLRVDDEDVPESAADTVFAWLREVDARFSPFKPDSEVSRHGRGELAPHELLGVLPDADAATLCYARDVLLASFDPERLPSCAGPTRRKLEIIVACVNEAYEMITEGQAAVRAARGASRA